MGNVDSVPSPHSKRSYPMKKSKSNHGPQTRDSLVHHLCDQNCSNKYQMSPEKMIETQSNSSARTQLLTNSNNVINSDRSSTLSNSSSLSHSDQKSDSVGNVNDHPIEPVIRHQLQRGGQDFTKQDLVFILCRLEGRSDHEYKSQLFKLRLIDLRAAIRILIFSDDIVSRELMEEEGAAFYNIKQTYAVKNIVPERFDV